MGTKHFCSTGNFGVAAVTLKNVYLHWQLHVIVNVVDLHFGNSWARFSADQTALKKKCHLKNEIKKIEGIFVCNKWKESANETSENCPKKSPIYVATMLLSIGDGDCAQIFSFDLFGGCEDLERIKCNNVNVLYFNYLLNCVTHKQRRAVLTVIPSSSSQHHILYWRTTSFYNITHMPEVDIWILGRWYK